MTARVSPSPAGNDACVWRLAVGAIYAVIAVASAATWWRGMIPFPFLGGDAGDIASWAAAWAEPDRFAGDMALGERRHYAIYAVLHIPLLIALMPLFGDYGTAFLVLLAPVIFAQAVGTYLLGRRLLSDRWGAFALGLTAFGFTWFGPGDYYGFYHDAQPRVLFQAVLPYLLILQFHWGARPERWPWLFAIHGVAMYVHPVSAPAVAFASWLALPVLAGPACDRRRIAVGLATAASAFLAVALPFVVNYLAYRDSGGGSAASAGFVGATFGAEFASVGAYLRAAFAEWRFAFVALPFGIAGAVAVWRLAPDRRPFLVFFLVWLAGILIVAVGLTAADQALAEALGRQPVQIDLVRDVRFLLPVLAWFGFWGGFLVLRRRATRVVSWGMVALAAAWLAVNKPGAVPVRATLACLASGRVFCPTPEWIEDRAALRLLKSRLAERTTVLAALEDARGRAFSLAIRYFALLPVAFSFQDGGSSLGYSNLKAARAWRATAEALRAVLHRSDGPDKTAALLAVAERIKAEAAIAEFAIAPEHLLPGWRILDRSGRYTIIVSTSARERAPPPAAR